MVLIRDACRLLRAAAAFSSADASTIPNAFFWFGQITNRTLKAMMSASHMPMPIA
jgi:hypothetical protein